MTVGERIKKIREQKGIKQKDLAEKLGISYVMLSQYERGVRTPKYKTVDKIALALDVTPLYLMYGDESTIIDTKIIDVINQSKEDVDQITKKIKTVINSFDVNEIEYKITKQTEYHNYILEIEVKWNKLTFTLDTDDLVDIYDKAQNSFNNSVKNIIDILSTYKKQGD